MKWPSVRTFPFGLTGMKYVARRVPRKRSRRGAASLDYILVLGVILPLVAFALTAGRRIVQLVYEMIVVWVAWPFM